MSTTAARERLNHLAQRYVLRCTPELFAAYEVPIGVIEANNKPMHTTDRSLVGIVGFLGDVCGLLALRINSDVVTATHPLRTQSTITPQMMFDWTSELSNQLIGRIKIKLAVHGLHFRVSAPVCMESARLRFIGVSGETCRASFGAPTGDLNVWVDAEVRDSVGWSDAFFQDREPEPEIEGTVVFL